MSKLYKVIWEIYAKFLRTVQRFVTVFYMCVEMPRTQIQSNNTSFIATYFYASALVKSLLVSFYSVEIPKTSTRRKIRGFYNLWKKNQINDVL